MKRSLCFEGGGVFDDVLQGLYQARTGLPQFVPMQSRETAERFRPLPSQADTDLAPIAIPPRPFYQPVSFQAVEQSDRAVVPEDEVLRESSDRRFLIFAKSLNRQHHLVLLGLQPFAARRFLAELQE